MTKNRIGICEWVFPVQGPDALSWAARLGYDGIQIAECGGYETGYPLLKPDVQEAYRSVQQETGIEIQALHLWSLCRMACMIHPLKSAAGKLALTYIQKAIDSCRQMRIPRLMLTSGFLCQIKNQKDFDIFSQYLSAACKMAEDAGIRVVFESALTPNEILEMCRRVKGLKICYDLFNPFRFALGDPVEEIEEIGLEYIDHIHAKDGPANMVGCSLLGKGVGRYHDIIALLRKLGYSGWLVTENYYNAPPISTNMSFDEAARQDLETMRAFE